MTVTQNVSVEGPTENGASFNSKLKKEVTQFMPKSLKVKYIGETCYEFDHGQILTATFLKKDPQEKWYVIKSVRDGETYAFPREIFEVIEEYE